MILEFNTFLYLQQESISSNFRIFNCKYIQSLYSKVEW